jgi:hypothetical protein
MRIVVGHQRTLFVEQVNDVERRKLAHIIDITLVGDAQRQHPTAFHRAPGVVQCILHLLHPIARHLGIDLACQIDKPRSVVQHFQFPRQVERIDRDTMPAQTRSRRKFHKPERLGRCGIDYLPHIQPEFVAHEQHFIHQPDVDGTEGVFEQLDHLRYFRAAHRHHAFNRRFVQRARRFQAGRGYSAHDLRRIPRCPVDTTRIDPFGRKCQEIIHSDRQAAGFEAWQDNLAGGAGVGGAFQDDQLTGAQPVRNLLGDRHDRRDVGIACFAQRSRHADADRIQV